MPLNVFRLPRPQDPGDRRMFHFMHDGWHNADNGGANVLYRGRGGGRLERLDTAALGMPETHWSLAVATVDLNRDGFTDLYVANDFGPDEFFIDQANPPRAAVEEVMQALRDGMDSSGVWCS